MCRWIGSPVGLPSTRSRHSSGPGGCCNSRCGGRSAGESGFTLIEVLVAFAVLAIVLVPLLQVFGGGLGTTQTARAYTQAALLARSKLDEMGVEAPLVEGEETGTFDAPGFRWRTEVTRDTSEVIAPEPSAGSRDSERSRRSEKSDTSGRTSRSRTGSSAGRDESFARGGTGFGASRSSFSNSGNSFAGHRRSGFGTDSSDDSRSSSGAEDGGLGDDEQFGGEAPLLVYRVIVTVEWGAGAGKSFTLSTLRIGRPPDETNGGNDAGSGSGTSRFGRERSGTSGSGFGSQFDSDR